MSLAIPKAGVTIPAEWHNGSAPPKQNRRSFAGPTAVFTANLSLRLNDPRSYEENQLLVRGADGGVFEQVAQPRNVAEQRNLRHVD